MKINKRELIRNLRQGDLWKKLSSEEIRLYLLFVIFADKIKESGKLSSKVLSRYLGNNFSLDQLEKAAYSLQDFHLVKLDILSSEREIELPLLAE